MMATMDNNWHNYPAEEPAKPGPVQVAIKFPDGSTDYVCVFWTGSFFSHSSSEDKDDADDKLVVTKWRALQAE